MKELQYNEKIAVIKILSDILKADSFVRDSEVKYINEVISSFNLNGTYKEDVDKMSTLNALSLINELPFLLKNNISKMLGKMIIVDKDINYNEVKLYNVFCEFCGIHDNFNIDDYPEYSLSGPFQVPDELSGLL